MTRGIKYDVYVRGNAHPADSFILDFQNGERLNIEGSCAVVRKSLYEITAVYSDFVSIQRSE